MTTLAEGPVQAGERGREPAGPSSRRLLGRLSTGHLLMLLAGAVAAVANYAVLAGSTDRVAVLVADATIEAGERLDAAALGTVETAAGGPVIDQLIPADQREQLVGGVATARLHAGEPLRRSDVREPAASEGRRAMSLPIDAHRAVGGALQPGDRVDVIETAEGRASYLVTDAPVLALPDAGGLDGLQGFSVTIAVDADEALRLAEALHDRDLDVVRATGAEPAEPGAQS